jgi:signal transduction histidine kinase
MADDIMQGDSPLLSTEILATMSHELRGPLTSIKGYAATLRRHEQRLSPEERHAFLQAIEDASDRLALLMDRFFELAQLEAGTLPFLPELVSPVSLVQEAMQTAQKHVQANHLQDVPQAPEQSPLTLDLEHVASLPPPEEPLIWADRQRVHEVLNHLLENAILYAPQGSTIDIVLRPLRLSSERQQFPTPPHSTLLDGQGSPQQDFSGFEICICDHGIGIPDEYLEQIFERFYRIDTRLVREVNGLGVGLTICKYIVEMHGGQIWVESQVAQGSTFHLWFPAYRLSENKKP